MKRVYNNPIIGKDNKYHYLYKITNLINEHYYYGVHSTSDNYLKDGYSGSGIALKNAYKKYGKENFRFEIIEYFSDSYLMYQSEKKIVII